MGWSGVRRTLPPATRRGQSGATGVRARAACLGTQRGPGSRPFEPGPHAWARKGPGSRPVPIPMAGKARFSVAQFLQCLMFASNCISGMLCPVHPWLPQRSSGAGSGASLSQVRVWHGLAFVAECIWVHSSVVRAADCRSAGPWFKSGCALPIAPAKPWRRGWDWSAALLAAWFDHAVAANWSHTFATVDVCGAISRAGRRGRHKSRERKREIERERESERDKQKNQTCEDRRTKRTRFEGASYTVA